MSLPERSLALATFGDMQCFLTSCALLLMDRAERINMHCSVRKQARIGLILWNTTTFRIRHLKQERALRVIHSFEVAPPSNELNTSRIEKRSSYNRRVWRKYLVLVLVYNQEPSRSLHLGHVAHINRQPHPPGPPTPLMQSELTKRLDES